MCAAPIASACPRATLPTRYLTTDQRLAPARARRLLDESGLRPDAGFWRFVPSGDLPRPLGSCAASWIASDDGSLRRLYGVSSVWPLWSELRLVGRPTDGRVGGRHVSANNLSFGQ